MLVDTGAWYALADRSDRHHDRARRFYLEEAPKGRLITTDLIVSEGWSLIAAHLGRTSALTFWETLRVARIPILPLEKPFRPEQLLSAVNQLLQSPIPPSSAPLGDAQKPISPRPEPAVPPYSGFEDLREKAIERELQKRAANQRAFAFCCLDLHNLRAYNDHYGFAKTTGLIRQTGDLLHEIISKFGSDDDFLGHVPGDDFVFITAPESVDGVCYRTIAAFDRIMPLYYDQPDRIRGYIEAKDRTGEQRQYPLLCASIVAVLCDGQSADHQQLARQATELKLRVKELKGSVYLRSDREQAIRSMSIA